MMDEGLRVSVTARTRDETETLMVGKPTKVDRVGSGRQQTYVVIPAEAERAILPSRSKPQKLKTKPQKLRKRLRAGGGFARVPATRPSLAGAAGSSPTAG